MNRLCCLLFLIVLVPSVYSQDITVAKVIAENSIVAFEQQKLILLDFWATWCGPCHTASKQLEYFQATHKDKLFVMSISDESSSVLKKFQEKKPSRLMVVADYQSTNFDKYHIEKRPYAVLLDLAGNALWQGHPSDLSATMLQTFYEAQKYKAVKPLAHILKVKFPDEPIESASEPVALRIEDSRSEDTELIFGERSVVFDGTISKLFTALLDLYPCEVSVASAADKRIRVTCSSAMWKEKKQDIVEQVLRVNNLVKTEIEQEFTGQELVITDEKMLWDSTQIHLEENTLNYQIGTDRIQADNISISELCKLLSGVKKTNYFFTKTNNGVYDWDFHFLYDKLMKEELESAFGVVLKPIKITLKVLKITSVQHSRLIKQTSKG